MALKFHSTLYAMIALGAALSFRTPSPPEDQISGEGDTVSLGADLGTAPVRPQGGSSALKGVVYPDVGSTARR
jgi:hypothetical protein